MPPYKLLLTYYVWRVVWLNWIAYSDLPWRPFLGHQAWSWTTLRRGNVSLLRLQKFFFLFLSRFTFLTFLIFIWTFLHLRPTILYHCQFVTSVSVPTAMSQQTEIHHTTLHQMEHEMEHEMRADRKNTVVNRPKMGKKQYNNICISNWFMLYKSHQIRFSTFD